MKQTSPTTFWKTKRIQNLPEVTFIYNIIFIYRYLNLRTIFIRSRQHNLGMAEVITVVETINLNIHLRVKSNHGLSTCNWMNVWTLLLNLHISSRQGKDKFAVEKKAQILEVEVVEEIKSFVEMGNTIMVNDKRFQDLWKIKTLVFATHNWALQNYKL